MCNLSTRIALARAAGGLLSLSAAPFGYVAPLAKQVSNGTAQLAPVAQPSVTLFKNVKVFDGKSDKLTASTSVLVVGNKIEKIGSDIAAPEDATVIDAEGRTLMPGLIDAHWHAMLVRPTPAAAISWEIGYADM